MSQDGQRFDLVAGIDYSDVSDAVLQVALDITRHRGGRLHAISVAGGYGPPRLPDDLDKAGPENEEPPDPSARPDPITL